MDFLLRRQTGMKNILVTGGAGYIGSHTVQELMKSKEFNPIVYDNLVTGHIEAIPQGGTFHKWRYP